MTIPTIRCKKYSKVVSPLPSGRQAPAECLLDVVDQPVYAHCVDNPYDSGLFQHSSSADYSHLLREILLTHRQLMRRLSAESGLSGAQFEVMRELALADGRSTVSALARSLDLDPAAISRIVAGLNESGLVTRESDQTDKRRQPVVLSDKGRGFMLAFHRKVHESEAALAGSVDPGSLETAARVLSTLREALESASRRR